MKKFNIVRSENSTRFATGKGLPTEGFATNNAVLTVTETDEFTVIEGSVACTQSLSITKKGFEATLDLDAVTTGFDLKGTNINKDKSVLTTVFYGEEFYVNIAKSTFVDLGDGKLLVSTPETATASIKTVEFSISIRIDKILNKD